MASEVQRDVLPIPDRPYEGLGEGRVEHTVPMMFSGDETTDLARDSATPVSDDHGYDNAFNRAGSAGSRSTSTRPPMTWTT